MGFLRANGLIFFGWAKPVETNPLRWRNKDVANISVAAAGPISNFILAAAAFIALRLMLTSGSFVPGGYGPYDLISPAVADAGLMTPVATMISMMLLTNVSLGVFNLIPIPPLDGSHVLETLLPASLAEAYGQLRQFGWILLIGLSMLGVFRLVLLPVITFVVRQLYS
jgi:Zn-dependent protease